MTAVLTSRQRAEARLVRTLAGLPVPAKRALAGRPAPVDGQLLDPEVGLLLRLMALQAEDSFETRPVATAREMIRTEAAQFAGRPVPGVAAQDLQVGGAAGPLPARLYLPDGSRRPGPLIVYYHGGGWVVGDLDSHDPACRFLCRASGVPVLAVDYRLAPEHPFPAAVDDAVASFRWAVDHAAELGVDPARVAVAGDSAGGNLAAVVAQQTALAGGPAPALQVLIYPATDLSTDRRSHALFASGYFLTEAQMAWYRGHYLTDEAMVRDPRVSPLLAEDVTGLAPAYVTVGGYDVLRDETVAYAERLRLAGVPTTLRVHPGLIHGFVNATGVGRASARAVREMALAVAAGLGVGRTVSGAPRV